MTPPKVLDFLHNFAGHQELSSIGLIHIQEIIVDVGISFQESERWTLVAGKKADEWRGTAIAFSSTYTHAHSTLHLRGCSVVLSNDKHKWGVVSGHIPHHATADETQEILRDWDRAKAMAQSRVVVGLDANEVFTFSETAPYFPRGNTARGEAILQWAAEHSLIFPHQEMHKPTHFPYSGQSPRRLDYLMVKGSHLRDGRVGEHRDRASSDHEPVLATFQMPRPPRQGGTHWGPRHLRQKHHELLDKEYNQGDLHHQIASIARDMTVRGRDSERFRESKDLKAARRRAQQVPPGPERKAAWKQVQATVRDERKAWHTKLHEAASKRDWRAYRAHKQLLRTREWEHYLLDDENWQGALKAHFETIFKKEAPDQVARHIRERGEQLSRLCKQADWKPFTFEELQVTQARWPRRKAAGPDGIVHEALRVLTLDHKWSWRILYVLNDALYRGTLPELLQRGITVLLPKAPTPSGWSDMRPITISSAMLKWLAQLLLRRTQHLLKPLCTLQWCSKGRQSVEMLLAIRKLARMARDWGTPFIIVKLDVKKAFDSASQCSMSDLITTHIGQQGHPWEARVWLSLLHATEMNVEFGGETIQIDQANGVRQGGPDSPVVFSALIGEALQQTAAKATTKQRTPDPRLPPPPHYTAGYMDDVYVWGETPEHVQEIISILEKILAEHGLYINHLKTCAISNKEAHQIQIAGHSVTTCGPDHPIMVLGSPVSFAGGPAHLMAEMSTRARKAFYANRKTLCAKTKLASRLKAHNAIVREAALWGAPTWPIHDTLLRNANSIQLQHTRTMMGLNRKPGEPWHEWNARTLRAARVTLHKLEIPRWSTRALEAIWNLWGHVGRAPDTTTRELLAWRGMQFWSEEQQKPSSIGARHAGRYNPNLDTERHIAAAAAGNNKWWESTLHREAWQHMAQAFIDKHDVPWSSGRQPALNNLAPNRRTRHPPRPRRQAITHDDWTRIGQ